MDIGKGNGYPSASLSNFHPHSFIFDGVACASMEGLLQSFKFDKEHMQEFVCQLYGLKAKFRGMKRNKAWRRVQKLWWKGVEYDRHGKDYQDLLDRAYLALATNQSFVSALLNTQQAVLTHSIGKTDPHETVLTQSEFCSRLTSLRKKLQPQR